MATNWTLFGFVVLLDSAGLTCWWLIRQMRMMTDERMEHRRRLQSESNKIQAFVEEKMIPKNVSHSWIHIQRFFRDLKGFNSTSSSSASVSSSDIERVSTARWRWFEKIKKVLFVIDNSVEPNTIEHFPNWEPIPYKATAFATLLILSLITILLTPSFFLNQIAGQSNYPNQNHKPTVAQLCQAQYENHQRNQSKEINSYSFNENIQMIQRILENMTNLEMARIQYNYTLSLRNALYADAEYYGTPTHPCIHDLLMTKEEWQERFPNNGYFPKWCEQWKQEQINRSKGELLCKTEEVCETICVQTSAGVSTKNCDLGNVTTCSPPIEYPCPSDTNVMQEEIDLHSFQIEQHQRRKRINLLRESQSQQFKDMIVNDIQDTGNNVLDMLMNQINIASHLYIGYLFLSMLFPSPLILYKSTKSVRMKRLIFGMHKSTFIIFVLFLWWGYDYFHRYFENPDFILYLKNMMQNPCYVDPDFMEMKQTEIRLTCLELAEKNTNFAILKEEIDLILFEGDFVFRTCKCGYPMESLSEFLTIPKYIYGLQEEPSLFQEMGMAFRYVPGTGFQSESGHDYVIEGFYSPSLGSNFLGNITVCKDNALITEIFLTAPKGNVKWISFWMASGTFVQLFAKIIIANFCLCLIKVADPLGMVGGMFESPAEKYFDDRKANIQELQSENFLILKTIAWRGCFFWGFLTQSFIINLFVIAIEIDLENVEEKATKIDIFIGVFSLGLSIVTPLLGLWMNSLFRKSIISNDSCVSLSR